MDWPVFALITYAFFLALLLALLILRSLRGTKGRYQKLLEEKEQKLVAMQVDLEETLEALQAQATLLETEWSAAQRRSQDSLLGVQHRLLDMQGTLVSLQSRIYRLEREPGPAFGAPAEEPIPARQGERAWAEPPGAALIPGPQAAAAPGACGAEETGPVAPPEWKPPRQRALALLQSGMSIAEVSREMGCSWTEATLLYSQWRRGYLKEDLEYGSED